MNTHKQLKLDCNPLGSAFFVSREIDRWCWRISFFQFYFFRLIKISSKHDFHSRVDLNVQMHICQHGTQEFLRTVHVAAMCRISQQYIFSCCFWWTCLFLNIVFLCVYCGYCNVFLSLLYDCTSIIFIMVSWLTYIESFHSKNTLNRNTHIDAFFHIESEMKTMQTTQISVLYCIDAIKIRLSSDQSSVVMFAVYINGSRTSNLACGQK